MTTTAVTICSNALLRLGAAPINSFDEAETEGIDRARIAANLWPSVSDDVLRSHPWNCAVKRVVLSPSATAPAFEWAYQYTLPSDWLRTLSVNDSETWTDSWRQEGGKVLYNSNTLNLRYIARISPASFDSMLSKALELAMAHAMAYPLTKSTSLRDSMEAELERHMRKARSVNGQEDTAEQFAEDDTLSVRLGYYAG